MEPYPRAGVRTHLCSLVLLISERRIWKFSTLVIDRRPFFHVCNGLFHNEQLGTKNGVRRLTANICVSDPVCGKFHSCDGKKYGFLPLLQKKSGQGIESAMLYAVDRFHRHALAESLQS